jgi:predicted nucleic acid-binding protein
MIIADTNIWIDHFRRADPQLSELLLRKRVLLHPFVLGEVSLGASGRTREWFDVLSDVRVAPVAMLGEVADLIQREQLYGSGIGYVYAHLLASARLVSGGRLWTRDERLHAQAMRLNIAYTAERSHSVQAG